VRRIVIISTLLIGSTLAAAPAAVAKPPVGGCPTSEWELRASPAPDITGSASVDQNGDGLSCYLEAPEGGGIFTIVDNPVTHR
jgi:hypothetical protein